MKRILLLDDYNKTIHSGESCIGTVIQTFGHLAFNNGWKIIEIYESDYNGQDIRGGDKTTEVV